MRIKGVLLAAAPCSGAANKKNVFGRFSSSLLYPFLTAVVWPLKCLKVLSRRIFIYLSHSSFCSNPILI